MRIMSKLSPRKKKKKTDSYPDSSVALNIAYQARLVEPSAVTWATAVALPDNRDSVQIFFDRLLKRPAPAVKYHVEGAHSVGPCVIDFGPYAPKLGVVIRSLSLLTATGDTVSYFNVKPQFITDNNHHVCTIER